MLAERAILRSEGAASKTLFAIEPARRDVARKRWRFLQDRLVAFFLRR
jgi:hypothetical protein